MKTLYIKNMVCEKCIQIVKEEMEKLRIVVESIVLGKVRVEYSENEISKDLINKTLKESGFELVSDRNINTILQVKDCIINLIHFEDLEKYRDLNITDIIEKELKLEYHYLKSLFSSVENISIEYFILLQKIAKTKELLKYERSTLKLIAFKLGFSSSQNLSYHFKTMTGITATQFKKLIKKD